MRTRPWFKSRWPWVTVTLGITISLLVLATRSSPRKTTVRIAAPGPEHDRPRDGSEVHEGLRYLDAMSEPSLKAIATADRSLTVYRVVWLPTFHRPISVRVVKSETGATLHATQLDGAGGYQPGKVSVRKTVELSRGQWDDLSRLVSEARLWSLPSAGVPRLITDGDC